jgi:predicted 3-demethylubiquinone-9 3-methyltransferase (glyoxalase superfamily)
LGELLNAKNAAKSQRAMQAMLKMKKLDIEAMKLAYDQGED